MLYWRLIIGALLVILLAALCWLDFYQALGAPAGGWVVPLVPVIAWLAAGEARTLARSAEQWPLAWIVYSGTMAVVLLAVVPVYYPAAQHAVLGTLGWPLMGLTAGVLIALVGEVLRFERPGGVIGRLATSVFAMVYVGLLLSFLIELRLVGEGPVGLMALVSMMLVVKMSDIGAYFVGRFAGRHKLAPILSPGKTWEGAAGGILFACGSAYAFFEHILPAMGLEPTVPSTPPFGWLLYGIVLTAAGIIGDLAESLLKRDAHRKDSSRWLPGFGGVLDLIDSMLTTAPVAYVCWITGLVGIEGLG